MSNSRLQYLFERYFDKTASVEERAELAELLGMESHREEFMQLFAAAWEKYEGEGMVISTKKSDEILRSVLSMPAPSIPVAVVSDPAAKVRRMAGWMKAAAAAAVVFVMTYIYRAEIFPGSNSAGIRTAKAGVTDVGPGSYRASLMLADGRRVTLDSLGPGQLAVQGNTKIINKNGGLLYQQGGEKSGPVIYNTLTTAKGQTYSFSLADGSKVWLNSASSIRFPVAFAGKERRIVITGEVYIEVAKDPRKSFVATAGGLEVAALGTAFNVMAYPDEEHISTTLVEGAVRLTGAGEKVVLRPGEQAKLDEKGSLSRPENVDLDEVVAWKEGNFQFEDADIKTILRQFARWYDVEVTYEGPVKNRKFFGLVSRNSTLASVLEMLKASDISFRIEGKRLYVKSV